MPTPSASVPGTHRQPPPRLGPFRPCLHWGRKREFRRCLTPVVGGNPGAGAGTQTHLWQKRAPASLSLASVNLKVYTAQGSLRAQSRCLVELRAALGRAPTSCPSGTGGQHSPSLSPAAVDVCYGPRVQTRVNHIPANETQWSRDFFFLSMHLYLSHACLFS